MIVPRATNWRTLPLEPNVLQFLDCDVPEPPAEVGLDIDQLSSIWDATWPTWKDASPLIIKNLPIPLKHFQSVYAGTGRWKQLKQQWSKWNVKEFWKKWSNDGKRSTPSKILDGLAKERKEKEQADSNKAKETYGTGFQERFTYKKGGKTYKMKSKKAIAQRFRKLQGLS
ncbi:hypothetical protein F5887DRAFT_891815 [Amanita rubescens]|nr:hypothetical protein F5887DRAFT_891815 [Amanita rubescens]